MWNMLTACWDQKRERRLKMCAVCRQLSASSIQDVTEGGRDNQSTSQVDRPVPFSEVQIQMATPSSRADDRGRGWSSEDVESTSIHAPDAPNESLESWYEDPNGGSGEGESLSETWDEPLPPPPVEEAMPEPGEKLEEFCGDRDQGTAPAPATCPPKPAERELPDLPDHDHRQSPPAPSRPSNALTKRGGGTRSRAAPLPSLPRTAFKRSVFSVLPCTTRDPEETEGFHRQVQRSRKSAAWGCKWTRTAFDTLKAAFKRTRKPPGTHQRSSR